MGVVYCAENLVNGYKYIGITVQKLEIRQKGHFNAAYNPLNIGYNRPFMCALRDNSNLFKWYIIEESDSVTELKKLEKFYINKFRTYIGYDDCMGYNATLGGDGVSVIGEEIYRVDSKTYKIKEKYKNSSEVLKTFNTKTHIIMCCQGVRESAYGDVWYYKSDYTSLSSEDLMKDIDYRVNKIYKIDKNHKILLRFNNLEELLQSNGHKFRDIYLNSKYLGFCFAKDYYSGKYDSGLYSNEKIVLQYDSDGRLLNIFLSLHNAENQTGVSRVSITEVCDHKKITSGGFQWRYISDKSVVNKVKVGAENVIKKVSQYTKDGVYIQTFNSISEAAKSIGLDSSSISKVCYGKKQTAGGFRWMFGDSKKNLGILKIYENNQKKPVCFKDENENIFIYESINEASRKTGMSSSYISKACKNMYKKSNWFFYKEN